jgi:CRP/FNR family cyclic AMP-dependent transcriptional regulator
LPAGVLGAFEAIKAVAAYSGGTVLFREGHSARGVFLVCEGKVRLWGSSESGKQLTVRIAGPGEVLGLSAMFSKGSHEVTAETLGSCQLAMIKCNDLRHFLQRYLAGTTFAQQ